MPWEPVVCLVPDLGGQWRDKRMSLLGLSLAHSALKKCLEKAFLVDGDVSKKSNKN